jgi:hypothetical protein
MKPILLLDVDGAVCPVSEKPPVHIWPENAWMEAEVSTLDDCRWKMRAAEPVVRFLHRLHFLDVADIRWHTTWQHGVYALEEALGLPAFPVQTALPNGPIRRGPDWKVEAVRLLLKQGNNVIWVDDDAARWLPQTLGLQSYPGRLWTVTPLEREGLGMDHLEQICQIIGIDFKDNEGGL